MNAVAELMLQNTLLAAPFALLVAVGSRIWRRPAVTHFLWLLVLLKLLAPPLVTIPIRPFYTTEPVRPASECPLGLAEEPVGLVITSADEPVEVTWAGPGAENEAPRHEPEAAVLPALPWPAWCLGISLAGSAAYFLVLRIRVRQFAGLLGDARAAPPSITARAARLCKSIGLRQCPVIRYVPGQIPPTVWGWGAKTRILVPAGLFERLEAGAQDALLLHELAHVRRRDHWVRLVEILVTGLYWWNPVVWLARRELREAEEQCCDRYVLRAFPGASRTYANVLVDTVDFLSGARFALPPVASAAGPTRSLRRRIEMVMCGTDLRSWSWMSRLAVAVAALLLLPLGATWAEDAEKGQTEEKVVDTVPAENVEKVVVEQAPDVVGPEKVLVLETLDADAGPSTQAGDAETRKVDRRVITVITKGDGEGRTSQIQVPWNALTTQQTATAAAKAETRKLKRTGRPTSVTIAYDDGEKETIELDDCNLLTLDVKAGTVSLAQRPKVITLSTKDRVVRFQTREGEPIVPTLPGTTRPQVVTQTFVTEHKADGKKDAGIEDRLERLEALLLKLQEEIKALKQPDINSLEIP